MVKSERSNSRSSETKQQERGQRPQIGVKFELRFVTRKKRELPVRGSGVERRTSKKKEEGMKAANSSTEPKTFPRMEGRGGGNEGGEGGSFRKITRVDYQRMSAVSRCVASAGMRKTPGKGCTPLRRNSIKYR